MENVIFIYYQPFRLQALTPAGPRFPFKYMALNDHVAYLSIHIHPSISSSFYGWVSELEFEKGGSALVLRKATLMTMITFLKEN